MIKAGKMPVHSKPVQESIEDTTINGGCTKETKQKRARERKYFNDFLVEHYGGKTLEDLCKEIDRAALIEVLNNALRGYYQTMLVNCKTHNEEGEDINENLSPKRKTAECSRSHVKKFILDEAKLDISGPDFSTFNVSFS